MKLISEKPKIKIPRKIRKLKWGVAGCGHFLENTFLPTFLQLKRSSLVSVYSHNLDRAKFISNKFLAQNAFNNFDEFLKSDFDTLYISSVNSDHYEQVIKAANAGKNILCEKPLALTSDQASEMVKVCEANNVYLAVNYVHRFHPLIVKAKQICENQMLGKIISVRADFHIDFPPNENFRFRKNKSGGGALRDLGTHMIDLLRYFGGEITDIKGFMDNVIYQSEVEDYSSALVKFKNGGFGSFSVSYSSKKAFNRIEITGYSGSISIENLIGKKIATSKLIIDLTGEARKAFRKRANKQIYLLRAFQKALLKKHPFSITGYDGYVNLRLMEELEKKCR